MLHRNPRSSATPVRCSEEIRVVGIGQKFHWIPMIYNLYMHIYAIYAPWQWLSLIYSFHLVSTCLLVCMSVMSEATSTSCLLVNSTCVCVCWSILIIYAHIHSCLQPYTTCILLDEINPCLPFNLDDISDSSPSISQLDIVIPIMVES